jgi:hydroxypyruvate reductase
MALAFLAQMDLDEERGRGIHFLSASPTAATAPRRGRGLRLHRSPGAGPKSAGLSIADSLRNNDSYHFFERIDGLFKTGTMTITSATCTSCSCPDGEWSVIFTLHLLHPPPG